MKAVGETEPIFGRDGQVIGTEETGRALLLLQTGTPEERKKLRTSRVKDLLAEACDPERTIEWRFIRASQADVELSLTVERKPVERDGPYEIRREKELATMYQYGVVREALDELKPLYQAYSRRLTSTTDEPGISPPAVIYTVADALDCDIDVSQVDG